MEKPLLKHIDDLIHDFREQHRGEPPLYVVLSPDEMKEAVETLKSKQNASEETVITTYRDIKLAEHPSLLNGNSYASNELPETGS